MVIETGLTLLRGLIFKSFGLEQALQPNKKTARPIMV